MKKLGLFVVVLLVTATVEMAKAQEKLQVYPINVNVENLDRYLLLSASQEEQVKSISDYFMQEQAESFTFDKSMQEKQMHNVMLGNLKLMREVLSQEQYKKYVAALNVTYNNYRMNGSEVSAINYADND